jgi:HKD family nuclease
MITRTIVQPETQLGNEIIELLDSNASFSRIVLVSAFVALRTILRLRERLLTHVGQRTDLLIIIGIDLGGTSREVLEELLRWKCRAFIFHNAIARATFHPKVYLFERSSAATLFVGSNNLTDGGLYTNYEVATRFDFSFPADEPEYKNLLKPLSQFLNPEGAAVRLLDKGLIKQLITRGELLSEAEARRHTGKRARGRPTEPMTVPANPFSAVAVPFAPPLPKGLRKRTSHRDPLKARQPTPLCSLDI